jgi:hypothetical protein
VKSKKLRGFLAKARDLVGLTGLDPLDLDPTAAAVAGLNSGGG